MNSGHKYQRLDSLRGLAAISVGVGHAFLCVDFSKDSQLQTAALGIFDGDYAVDLFFVLIAAAKEPGGEINRQTQSDRRWDLDESRRVSQSRTIKVEIAVSIVYPFLLAAWIKGGVAGKVATATGTAAIFLFSGHMLPHFIFLFVLGIAISDIRIPSARLASLAVATALVLMAVSGFLVRAHSAAADLIAGTSAALLIASVAYRCPGWLATVLDNRTILKVGRLSYAYYLMNPIVLWLIAHADARPLSRLLVAGNDLLAACAGVAGVCVAEAANRLIEKPAIAWSRAAEQGILRLLGNGLHARAPQPSR